MRPLLLPPKVGDIIRVVPVVPAEGVLHGQDRCPFRASVFIATVGSGT